MAAGCFLLLGFVHCGKPANCATGITHLPLVPSLSSTEVSSGTGENTGSFKKI
jgi:hypothetical protein